MNPSTILARAGRLALGAAVLAAGTVLASPLESLYDEHVIFDNSLSERSCYRSDGLVVAPSELELVEGRFPVEARHFVSAPNALRLKWKSAPGGDWRMKLKPRQPRDRAFSFAGDTLAFWCRAERELAPDQGPRIALQDVNNYGSGTIKLLPEDQLLPAGRWVRIRIPLARFKPMVGRTEDFQCDVSKLAAIWLIQGLDDDKPHTLYIDDVQIEPAEIADAAAPAAPAGLAVKGAERHFDLTWERSTATNILRYEIFRSWDGKEYEPVGIQQGQLNRYVDFAGKPGRTAFYRIRAMDLKGQESPLSAPVSAATHAFSDDELLDMAQEGCFRFYWEGGHPQAGMALELIPGDENLVAVGASGFGIMALIAGTERHFITRDPCAERLLKITRFLRGADRFHGAFPHFLDGSTGRTVPYFGRFDNGGDLVETAFLMEGLLTARQYFNRDNETEREIRETITKLWREVEWDWYRKEPGSDFLYWHWSPDAAWHINHPLVGWNETMMVYLLAIASPTHPVPASLYDSGWAGQSDAAVQYRQNWSRTTTGDHYTNGHSYYGFKLDVGEGTGADLFFTQFSFMGFDPRGKRDRFTDYFLNNRNIALINHAYCAENPGKHAGYSAECWGLSAGINSGGGRPQPSSDNGTICCSAALGSFPYTPRESMAALKHFYRALGEKGWGIYGFHDGFNESENWYEAAWMGLNQAVITVMIENYRSGVIWKNFMANPEIAPAQRAIGFKSTESGGGH